MFFCCGKPLRTSMANTSRLLRGADIASLLKLRSEPSLLKLWCLKRIPFLPFSSNQALRSGNPVRAQSFGGWWPQLRR